MGHTKTLAMEEQQQSQSLPAAPRKSIFNIQAEYQQLMYDIEDADGELTPDQEQQLTITKEQLETKAVNYAYLIKDTEFDVTKIDTEIKRLQRIKETKERMVGKLKDVVTHAMKTFEVGSIDKDNIKLSFRKSKQLSIAPDATIPKRFLNTKVSVTVDKKELKEYIESGKKIEGVTIMEFQNLQLK